MYVLRRGHTLISLLWLSLLLTACKESPKWTKAGPFFSGEDNASSTQAVVYVYWPREERGRPGQLWVGPCDETLKAVLPEGYTSFVVEPGPSCFQAERRWEFAAGKGSVSQDFGKVELKSEPGHSSFLRLAQEEGRLMSHFVLRRIEPDVAGPEIRRCRRSIPFSIEEIASRSR
jgi:hypothetical protein